MNDYKKVYEDAAKIHDEIERVKKCRKNALYCLDSISYLNPDEKEFVKNAIIAAYEPRIDDLMRKFFTVYEENKADTKTPKDKTYYEFDFDTWSIAIDSDVLHKARHHCCKADDGCNGCVLDDIPCVYSCYLEKKYLRGEYRILHKMEE